MTRHSQILGCLLGTAVGDAAGLRREGLSRRRAAKLYGDHVSPELLLRRGLCSDDTEHTVMVGRALALSGGDHVAFERHLANQLRMWLLSVPAGVGFATLRACVKLLLGVGPQRSGIWSAGNGPAMRSALLGVCTESEDECRELVRRCTRLTHTDPRAEEGALVVALAAGLSSWRSEHSPAEFLHEVAEQIQGDELRQRLVAVGESLAVGHSPGEFADSQGWSRGVTGYVNHTVPAALYCWAYAPADYGECVSHAVRLGGDADTVAAITGAIAGANLGAAAIPEPWLASVAEWPRTKQWIEQLAAVLAHNFGDEQQKHPPPMHWFATLPRNALFATVVLGLGFRRLLPPY